MSELPLLRIGTDPYEIHRIDLLSYVSLDAPPVSKSTKLAIHNHENRPSALLPRYANRTTQSSLEFAPCTLPESGGGKTTRTMGVLSEKQLLQEFKYIDYNYTTGG